MKRLEIIHLQMGNTLPHSLVDEIRKLPLEQQNDTDLTVYQREGLSTDLSVHIFHQADSQELPSPLGVMVAFSLREHGMMDHSIWTEEQTQKKEGLK
jgi:hypothetical protein